MGLYFISQNPGIPDLSWGNTSGYGVRSDAVTTRDLYYLQAWLVTNLKLACYAALRNLIWVWFYDAIRIELRSLIRIGLHSLLRIGLRSLTDR